MPTPPRRSRLRFAWRPRSQMHGTSRKKRAGARTISTETQGHGRSPAPAARSGPPRRGRPLCSWKEQHRLIASVSEPSWTTYPAIVRARGARGADRRCALPRRRQDGGALAMAGATGGPRVWPARAREMVAPRSRGGEHLGDVLARGLLNRGEQLHVEQRRAPLGIGRRSAAWASRIQAESAPASPSPSRSASIATSGHNMRPEGVRASRHAPRMGRRASRRDAASVAAASFAASSSHAGSRTVGFVVGALGSSHARSRPSAIASAQTGAPSCADPLRSPRDPRPRARPSRARRRRRAGCRRWCAARVRRRR